MKLGTGNATYRNGGFTVMFGDGRVMVRGYISGFGPLFLSDGLITCPFTQSSDLNPLNILRMNWIAIRPSCPTSLPDLTIALVAEWATHSHRHTDLVERAEGVILPQGTQLHINGHGITIGCPS